MSSFTQSALLVLILVLGLVSFSSADIVTGSFCFMMYGAPGNVEYPWATSTALDFYYDNTPVGSPSNPAVTLINGTGTRTYTNKYGNSISSTISLFANGVDFNDLLLYVNGAPVVDGNGLSWSVAPATQFPGHGPNDLRIEANIYTDSLGNVVEQDSFIQDTSSEAFYSDVVTSSGISFTNVVIPSTLPNAHNVDPVNCLASFSNGVFNNGLQPTPTTTGLPLSYLYSYYITDGVTWSTTVNLTLTVSSSTASVSLLGDYYQTVTQITGQRTYNYFPSSYTSTVAVTGIATTGSPDQRFYPFANTVIPPNNFPAYTMNNAPFIDYDGLAFTLASGQYGDGYGVGTTQYTSRTVFVYGSDSGVQIEENHTKSSAYPNGGLQQQIVA